MYQDLAIRETQNGGGSLPGSGIVGGIAGSVKVGKLLWDAKGFAELMKDLESNTFKAAIADVRYYRATGRGHAVFVPTSLINWSEAQVEWSRFGADNPALSDQQVVWNMVRWALGLP